VIRNLPKLLNRLPDAPGVYLFKDVGGTVIYAGKSASLRKRVRSYFRASHNLKVLLLAGEVRDIEVIPVASEPEALILENRCIKEYRPKYNVDLKDGKSYPLVTITSDAFPAVRIVREEKGNARYFGPFSDVGLVREITRFLRRHYRVRSCGVHLFRRGRVCCEYHIGRCSGPCAGRITKEEYRRDVGGIIAFFEGRDAAFKKRLVRRRDEASAHLDFERAAGLQQKIDLLGLARKRFAVRNEEQLVSYGRENALNRLAEILSLPGIPSLIEGYDVSNIGGTMGTASRVSFRGGSPEKNGYRHFRIRNAAEGDDYAMLKEALLRRFSHGTDGDLLPDLLLVDGGKGQLNAALEAAREADVNVPMISLAKKNEEIFLPGKKDPLVLPRDSAALRLLQRIRDEAHRFARSYHVYLHRRHAVGSLLDDIEGIGATRKRLLLKRFGAIERIRNASREELVAAGIPGAVADRLRLAITGKG